MAIKRKIAVFAGIILVLSVLWWVVQWVAHGGWPSSGPVGEPLPPNIQYVNPADGERVEEVHGFCTHFYYPAGNGIGEDRRGDVLYFFDGINITKKVIDIVTLEYGYPDPVGEPCYTRNKPLRAGWHTVMVRYIDNIGKEFEYTWRFQVFNAE